MILLVWKKNRLHKLKILQTDILKKIRKKGKDKNTRITWK